MERIDKILSVNCKISRRDVKSIIKQGKVSLNGKTVKDSAIKIDIENDVITVDGVQLKIKNHIYIMMNKPQGVVSAGETEKEKTVIDLVPDELFRKGLFPAGRLDKDTTGFVLITDDGEFAHRILSPKNHIFKTYEARLSRPIGENEMQMIRGGITLGDGTVLKEAKIEIVQNGEKPLVRIMICEGKYHQVKRMFAAAGNHVEKLHRVKMGNLELDRSLSLGECREITEEELKKIEN